MQCLLTVTVALSQCLPAAAVNNSTPKLTADLSFSQIFHFAATWRQKTTLEDTSGLQRLAEMTPMRTSEQVDEAETND